MTDAQIKERCVEAGGDIAWELVNTGKTAKLESLCREMVAEGLERAFKEFQSNKRLYCGTAGAFADRCRQEAARVKEGG